jgi:transcriptional regulator GlxA family with amidase domain
MMARKAKKPIETPIFLTQAELAKRWRMSPRTLERWRWLNTGVSWVKIGHLARYRLTDVEQYEREQFVP